MRTFVLPEGAPAATQTAFAQILAVHAALLPTGKILYFSGDQHDPGQHHLGLFDHARLFDCQTLAITTPVPSPTIRDLFCCGHTLLADGRLLVAGGTESWAGAPPGTGGHGSHGIFRGTAEAYVFEPVGAQWVPVPRMVPERFKTTGGGRWYPTLVTLGNGDAVAVAGPASNSDTRHINNTIETYTPAPGSGYWIDRGIVPGPLSAYPRAHLIKDATLFFTTPLAGFSVRWNTASFAWSVVCPGPGAEYDSFAVTSVLLPLLPEFGYRTRLLMCGSTVAKMIDLDDASPSWQPTQPRTLLVNGVSPIRTNLNAVLLPTSEVVVCGGFRDTTQDPAAAVLQIEIYHPLSNSWTTLPADANPTVPRNYHSVALLIPDGRVWIAGSNVAANWSFHNIADFPHSLPETAQQGTVDNRELRIELFEPWYFGRPDRPTISAAPASAPLGGRMEVTTPQASTINRVVVLRAGSVTHAFNADQRYVGLNFTRHDGGLTVNLPENPNLLPPGPYLLFVLDATAAPEAGALAGIPSVGRHLRIDGPAAPAPPKVTLQLNAASYHTGDTMTVVATVTPGGAPSPVDAYIMVQLTDGQFLSLQLNGPPVPGQVPIATNIVPAPVQQQVLQYTFTGAEPPGAYTWFAVFTVPGTMNFVSVLEQSPFVFAP